MAGCLVPWDAGHHQALHPEQWLHTWSVGQFWGEHPLGDWVGARGAELHQILPPQGAAPQNGQVGAGVPCNCPAPHLGRVGIPRDGKSAVLDLDLHPGMSGWVHGAHPRIQTGFAPQEWLESAGSPPQCTESRRGFHSRNCWRPSPERWIRAGRASHARGGARVLDPGRICTPGNTLVDP